MERLTTDQWDSYCRGLSALRSFCERPEIRALLPDEPSISSYNGKITASLWMYGQTGEKEIMITLARLLKMRKSYGSDSFSLSYSISPEVEFRVSCSRASVCERRVVRTELVPAETHTREAYEKEIVEWDCHPLLGETKE